MTTTNRLQVLLASLLLCGVGANAAYASEPVGVYCVPNRVELLPSDTRTPNEVVIHGAFFFLQKDGHYSEPACGYMHFICNKGEESMCLMQWKEIAAGIGDPDTCYGFGSWNMVSSATLYPEGTPLGKPDAWDLGMGIAHGFSVEEQCPAAHKLRCGIRKLEPQDNVPVGAGSESQAQTNAACTVVVGRNAGGSLASAAALVLGALVLVGARRRRSRR